MLTDNQVRYIRHPKFMEKGCEVSPDGRYVAVIENRQGKEGISIYTWSATALFKVSLYFFKRRKEINDIDKLL